MRNTENGLTLIELMITIAIIAILAVFSLQDNRLLRNKNELTTLRDQLISAVHYAKILALNLNKDVYLAHTAYSENWSEGMSLYLVENNTLLYQWQWQGKFRDWQVHWSGFNRKNIVVLASNPQHAYSNGHFIVKHKQSGYEERLTINRLGHIYLNLNE